MKCSLCQKEMTYKYCFMNKAKNKFMCKDCMDKKCTVDHIDDMDRINYFSDMAKDEQTRYFKHDSIFSQSIIAEGLNHRAEEDKKRISAISPTELLDRLDPFNQARKHGIEFADAIRYILPHTDGVSVYFKEKTPTLAKVIVNGPATVLFIEGKKYVAKCHDEEFDVTKGVLVCIAKYLGVTHSRIKAILKRRGLANSQDAELCLLLDIADRYGFDEGVVAVMVEKAKIYVKIIKEKK